MQDIKEIVFSNPSDSISQFSLRASAIIQSGDKFCMARNPGKEKYKLPGGHLHENESFLHALHRELHEEMDLIKESYTAELAFYDQLIVGSTIIITAYFKVTLHEASDSDREYFAVSELNSEMAYENEISALKHFAESIN